MPPRYIYLVLVRKFADRPNYPFAKTVSEYEDDSPGNDAEDDIDELFKHSDTIFSIHRCLDSAHSTACRIAHRLLRVVIRTNTYIRGDSWTEGEKFYRGLFVENGEEIEVAVEKWPVEGIMNDDGKTITEVWVILGGNGVEGDMAENDANRNAQAYREGELLAVFGRIRLAEEYVDWMIQGGMSVVIEEWDVWK
jgi:hypothetical protein